MARTHIKHGITDYITIDGFQIKQPDKDGFVQSWETTFTEDSGRVMSGSAQLDPMFTVENISAKWSNVWGSDVKDILQRILPKQGKPNFMLHYYSWYYGCWRDDLFYVGKGSLEVNQIAGDYTKASSISCNLIGVNPLV